MAGDKSQDGSSGKKNRDDEAGADAVNRDAASWNADAIPEALREAGRRAADLAQNPVARSLLAAGLVTAAAALATNKSVRDTTRRNVKEAQDATEAALEAAADNASKIGIAIINAATDAVQKMMSVSAGMMGAAGAVSTPQPEQAPPPAPAPEPKPAPPPRTSGRARSGNGKTGSAGNPATAKPRAKAAGVGGTTKASTTSRTAKPKSDSGGKGSGGEKAGSGRRRKSNNANNEGTGGS